MSELLRIINFYMDDSGTRHPDRHPGRTPAHGHDWFTLGGILIDAANERASREKHKEFCGSWNITYPLHSSEIRNKSNRFAWLGKLETKERERFYDELFKLLLDADVVGLACVVDRPGYNARYKEKYRKDRWLLCKTAFCIAVERATKYAIKNEAKLRVLPERSNKKDDGRLDAYFSELIASGSPFDSEREKGYQPLDATSYSKTLQDIKFKYKSSPLVQLADLYLWPMAIGGYDPENRPYAGFCEAKKLMDQQCADPTIEGIKYSCFELVRSKRDADTTKARDQ